MIPFLDLRAATAELREEIDAALKRVVDSGWFVLGPEVEAFEAEWASYTGTKHAVGTGNGLDALELALRAYDIGPGDEVIVPSHTFVATWLAVERTGATAVPVEPDETTMTLDASRMEASIGPRTRAVIPVHLYGRPANMDRIAQVARRRGLVIVEDAAQAHGARYRGQPAGSLGDVAAWSFYPAKNLGALGDAGAITTNDPVVAERVRRLRNYGSTLKYRHEVRGVNSRLDEMQSAVLRAKLPRLDEWNERRRAIAAAYEAGLAGTDVQLPPGADLVVLPSWHLFVVRSRKRDLLASRLRAAGIETLAHYPIAIHRQPAYAQQFEDTHLPIAEQLAEQVLSLPMGPHLSLEAAHQVIEAVRSGARAG